METKCNLCNNTVNVKPYRLKRIKHFFSCSQKCSSLIKKILYLGKNNPNNKYDINYNYFKSIDDEFKAYFLGWIASDGYINEKFIAISIHKNDYNILDKLKKLISSNLQIKNVKNNMITLTINSKEMAKDVANHLKIGFGKKSNMVCFPDIDTNLKNAFIRGFFDGDGHVCTITTTHKQPRCGITTNSANMRKNIINHINLPYWTDDKEKIEWSGTNAIDFLSKIYDNANIKLIRKYNNYLDVITWVPSISYSRYWKNDYFKYTKTRSDAVQPLKNNGSDSGFDLTLLEKIKTNGIVDIYDTGIKVSPTNGIYFDLVPRSSLIKTGYIMANSFGVIDRNYTGVIMVALIKIDKDSPDLKLPGRYVQLIPRPIIHYEFAEVTNLSSTDRGESGFGSSGL